MSTTSRRRCRFRPRSTTSRSSGSLLHRSSERGSGAIDAMSVATLLPFGVFLACMVIGAPIAIALGAGALAFFLSADGIPMEALVQKLQAPFGSFPLLAIPLYVFAASVLN